VAPHGPERETPRRRVGLAAGVMVLALAVPYTSDDIQSRVAVTLQGTALAPFIALQERITEGRARADQIEYLQAELDSLVAVASTQAALLEENRELRDLLGLAERAGPSFLPATVLRPGTPGSESMFLVDVGARDGVAEGAPVVSSRGLVGRIVEVRESNAVAIDWTHPDFRASAMLAQGGMFGLVENVRGEFREEDRLMLNGTAYHERAPEGSLVVTSGLAGLMPRGIPIGQIVATAEVEGSWRKSYWLRPLVDPGGVTHVLVETGPADADLSPLWPVDSTVTADSLAGDVAPARPARPGPRPNEQRTAPAPPQRVTPPVPAPVDRPPAMRDTLAPPATSPPSVQPDTLSPPPEAAPPPLERDTTQTSDSIAPLDPLTGVPG